MIGFFNPDWQYKCRLCGSSTIRRTHATDKYRWSCLKKGCRDFEWDHGYEADEVPEWVIAERNRWTEYVESLS